MERMCRDHAALTKLVLRALYLTARGRRVIAPAPRIHRLAHPAPEMIVAEAQFLAPGTGERRQVRRFDQPILPVPFQRPDQIVRQARPVR